MTRGEPYLLAGSAGEPFGAIHDRIGSSDTEGFGGTDQEDRVAGDGEGGNAFCGFGGADLSVADPDQLLLVAVVDFDVPAPEVGLDQILHGRVEVGADQICRLAIQKA